MTESNPPDKLSDLGRRILFLLKEKDRQDEYRHLLQIASDLEETREDVRDQLGILESEGLIEVTYFTNGDALPFITGKGKLKLEQWGQAAPQPDPPPISEPSPEPQEFEHSPDYRRVDWQGKKFRFSTMQSHVVRLLHEEFKEGGDEVGLAFLQEGIGSKGKFLSNNFRRHCAWGTLIIKGEGKGTCKLNLSRSLPPVVPNLPSDS